MTKRRREFKVGKTAEFELNGDDYDVFGIGPHFLVYGNEVHRFNTIKELRADQDRIFKDVAIGAWNEIEKQFPGKNFDDFYKVFDKPGDKRDKLSHAALRFREQFDKDVGKFGRVERLISKDHKRLFGLSSAAENAHNVFPKRVFASPPRTTRTKFSTPVSAAKSPAADYVKSARSEKVPPSRHTAERKGKLFEGERAKLRELAFEREGVKATERAERLFQAKKQKADFNKRLAEKARFVQQQKDYDRKRFTPEARRRVLRSGKVLDRVYDTKDLDGVQFPVYNDDSQIYRLPKRSSQRYKKDDRFKKVSFGRLDSERMHPVRNDIRHSLPASYKTAGRYNKQQTKYVVKSEPVPLFRKKHVSDFKKAERRVAFDLPDVSDFRAQRPMSKAQRKLFESEIRSVNPFAGPKAFEKQKAEVEYDEANDYDGARWRRETVGSKEYLAEQERLRLLEVNSKNSSSVKGKRSRSYKVISDDYDGGRFPGSMFTPSRLSFSEKNARAGGQVVHGNKWTPDDVYQASNILANVFRDFAHVTRSHTYDNQKKY